MSEPLPVHTFSLHIVITHSHSPAEAPFASLEQTHIKHSTNARRYEMKPRRKEFGLEELPALSMYAPASQLVQLDPPAITLKCMWSMLSERNVTYAIKMQVGI
jgi:hypothetical protein